MSPEKKTDTPAEQEPEGMFGTDKKYGFRVDAAFEIGEHFILFDASVDPEKVPTEIGYAKKTNLEVARLDEPDARFACTTLASAIAEKAEKATPADFPAVVQLLRVPSRFKNEALVIQYVRPYEA
jgi:hypothetical protein